MLKVYNECCKNCLLSKDRIVNSKAAKSIVKGCIEKQNHFFCHKSTMKGEEIVCKTFFDQFGHYSQMVRIAGRLNMISYVPQDNSERLPSYLEMSNRNKKLINKLDS